MDNISLKIGSNKASEFARSDALLHFISKKQKKGNTNEERRRSIYKIDKERIAARAGVQSASEAHLALDRRYYSEPYQCWDFSRNNISIYIDRKLQ